METKFTGGVFAYFFYRLSVYIVTIVTLGIGYPFIISAYMKWEVSHTNLNGQKMEFRGRASELFKSYIVWWTLSVLTVGVYYIVKMRLNILMWKTENTHIEGRTKTKSYLEVKWYQLLGAIIFSNFISFITLGIGYALACCYYREWLCNHIYIDDNKLQFTGTGKQFFLKYLGWSLLTSITLGVYGFWFVSNVKKWMTANTSFKFKEKVAVGKTVLALRPVPVLPKPAKAVAKPVIGEHYKRIYNFMMVKRAMICFTCEIPFLVAVTIALAFTVDNLTGILAPNLLWLVVLLTLPTIFLVEERLDDVGGIRFQRTKTLSIIGLIFSVAIPVFMPVFIYGLTETVRLKKWIYGEEKISKNSALTEEGKLIMPEQTKYFETSKEFQSYIWNCQNYKKAVKKYAKDMIEYNDRLKVCNDASERLGFPPTIC